MAFPKISLPLGSKCVYHIRETALASLERKHIGRVRARLFSADRPAWPDPDRAERVFWECAGPSLSAIPSASPGQPGLNGGRPSLKLLTLACKSLLLIAARQLMNCLGHHHP